MATYPELALTLHSNPGLDFSELLGGKRSYVTISNIEAIDKLKDVQADKSTLRSYHEHVHALLEVQVRAVEDLIQLQTSWVTHVLNDTDTQDELKGWNDQFSDYSSFVHSHHETQEASMLSSRLDDIDSQINQAEQTFEKYCEVNDERISVFSNFRDDSVDILENFQHKLL